MFIKKDTRTSDRNNLSFKNLHPDLFTLYKMRAARENGRRLRRIYYSQGGGTVGKICLPYLSLLSVRTFVVLYISARHRCHSALFLRRDFARSDSFIDNIATVYDQKYIPDAAAAAAAVVAGS